MNMTGKILLVEDDPSICEFLTYHLSSEGFDVNCVSDGAQGLDLALQQSFQLVILDLNLPRLSGIQVCREIRKVKPALPLLMLTSRDSEMDRVIGLEAGADDYVVKPFGVQELLARVRARLRISTVNGATAAPVKQELSCGPLVLNTELMNASLNGAPFSLTPKEFDVLVYLLRNPGRVINREELLRHVWGSSGDTYADAVSTLMRRLRRKLETSAPGFYLLRVIRGFGYRMADAGEHNKQPDDDGEG